MTFRTGTDCWIFNTRTTSSRTTNHHIHKISIKEYGPHNFRYLDQLPFGDQRKACRVYGNFLPSYFKRLYEQAYSMVGNTTIFDIKLMEG